MVFIALPPFSPVVFGYDNVSNAVLVTCQVELEGRQLVSVLDAVTQLLKTHPGSRLLFDLKHLVACDASHQAQLLEKWLPAARTLGLGTIVLVPPTRKRTAAVADGLKAKAGELGVRVNVFSSAEGAHQWLMTH